MASYLASHGRQVFEYAETMKPLAEEIDAAIAQEAAAAGLTIEWVMRPKSFRKEDRIQAILAERGDQPGLVHIFKVLETCTCFRPVAGQNDWAYDLASEDGQVRPLLYLFHRSRLSWASASCASPPGRRSDLNSIVTAIIGSPTNCAPQASASRNSITPFCKSTTGSALQALADAFPTEQLHQRLDAYARRFCPVIRHVPDGYHWS